MLKNHLISIISGNLGYEPTASQDALMEVLADFILRPDRKEVLLVKGFAGTGKTTLISALVKTLQHFRLRSVLMAPTGRAAKVFASFAGKTAYTIHKKIYRQKSTRDGFGKFVLEKNLHHKTLFLVDEASMISNQSRELSIFGSGRLLDDLITYVYNENSCKLILIGDTAQLPPVGLEISSALDKKVLEGYDLEVHEVFLSDIVRQALGSGILMNATSIRNQIESNDIRLPSLNLKGFDDIIRISGEDLIEEISGVYDKKGMESTMIVVRSNKMANKYNAGIRNQILWKESEIANGDYIMVVKNNYFWVDDDHQIDFIANGDIAEIKKIASYEERYGYRFADLVLTFPDYNNLELKAKAMLDTIMIEAPALNENQNKELFYKVLEDYPDTKSKKQQFDRVRNDPFFNALQIKFAYAVTCHKAQGGQWPTVFIDQGYLNQEMINIEYLRWLYTAITRATEKLYLVNFRDEYFGEL